MFNTLEKYPQFKNKAFVQRAKLNIKEIKDLPSKGCKGTADVSAVPHKTWDHSGPFSAQHLRLIWL